jgi:uncharacterized protein (DUF433 family)
MTEDDSASTAFGRISVDRWGKPCIRGMRITVGQILSLLASGHTEDEVLRIYPDLERADMRAALGYAAWRLEGTEAPAARGWIFSWKWSFPRFGRKALPSGASKQLPGPADSDTIVRRR